MSGIRPDSYYSELTITDGIMFATTMGQHPELVTPLLREMFPSEGIGSVLPSQMANGSAAIINAEHALFPAVYSHGVRYDVFHTDGRLLFDLEMHNSNLKKDDIKAEYVVRLIKRTRYSHSVMDVTSLKPGESYDAVKRHYVVYICTFDLFGKNGYCYEPTIPCLKGFPDVLFDEDRRTVFFNTKGSEGEVTDSMKEILKYMNDPKAYPVNETEVPVIKDIDSVVRFNQQSPEWRREYEVWMMHDMDVAFEARQEGEKNKVIEIVSRMLRRNKAIEEIAEDMELPVAEVLSIQKALEGQLSGRVGN